MQNDLRQGVTETQHAVLDELDTLRKTLEGEPRLRQLRQSTAFAGLQYANLNRPTDAKEKYANAIKGAAAMMFVAELLELEAK